MSTFDSLRRRFFGKPKPRTIRHRTLRLIEQLEDRTVPATLYVDNSPVIGGPGTDEFTPSGGTQTTQTGLTLGTDLFTTIQGAITAASSGDVINVADGTYAEFLTVDKTLTFRGNQFGADARSRAGTETIVTSGDGDFAIQADNVTIDGFTLEGATNNPSDPPYTALGAAIWTNPNFSGTLGGHQILNNIIQNNISGVYLNNEGTYPTLVQYNLFKDNTSPGPAGGFDVYSDLGLTNATIDANTFENTSFVESAWALGADYTGTSSGNIAFTNNDVTNHGRGAYFYATNGATVTGNTITGASHYGIGLFGYSGIPANQSFSISGNTLDVAGSGGAGVELYEDPGSSAYSGALTLSGDFYVTSGADHSILNESATAINATAETFNGVLASTATPAQQFAIVDTIVDGVDVPGFGLVTTGTGGSVYVTPGSYYAPDGTVTPALQRGVDVASPGDTIYVSAGTYTENVVVNKPLTLSGPNAGIAGTSGGRVAEAIVDGGVGTAITVSTTGTVDIDGFELLGQNGATDPGADLLIQNSVINAVGTAIDVSAANSAQILDNDITSTTGSGIYGLTVTTFVTVQGNTINAVDYGVHLDGIGGAVLVGGASAPLGNSITLTGAGSYGVFANSLASTFAAANNAIHGGGVAVGLDVQNAAGAVQIGGTVGEANTIDAATTGITVTSAASLTIQHNTLTNVVSGISLSAVGTSTVSRATIASNSATGLVGTLGILIDDGSGANFVSLTSNDVADFATGVKLSASGAGTDVSIGAGNAITGGTTGLEINGSLTVLAGDTLNNLTVSGQSGNYVELTGGALVGLTIDGTGATYGAVLGSGATTAQGYAIVDKIVDAADDPSLGYVRIKSGHVFVTPSSFSTPTTTTADIQRAVDVAVASDTVHVQGGSYTGNVDASTRTLTIDLGASPAQVTLIGNLAFGASDTLPIEINGTNPATLYDNILVTGTVTLNNAVLPALTGSYVSVAGDVFTIINNDTAADAVTGIFNLKPAGTVVTLNGQNLKVYYTGNDGNDVVLANQTVTTLYIDDSWSGMSDGDFILDADLGTTGDQSAIYGLNAFATFAAGMPYLSSGGTVIVNSGSYGEAVSLTGTQTMDITGPDLAGSVTIDALSSVAGTTLNLEGTSSLTLGDATSPTIAGVIAGGGSLTKIGSGALTLSGTNTYTGATAINAGTLSIGADAGLGTAPGVATPGFLTINGGTLQATASFALAATRGVALGPAVGSGGGTISVTGASSLTYAGIAADNGAGSGSLTKFGTGSLTLSGANTYTNGTTLSQGTLVHANNLATGSVTAPIAIGDANTGANATTLRFTAGVIDSNVSTVYKPITVNNFGTTTTFEFNEGAAYVNASLAISKAITITTTAGGTQNGLMGAISGTGAGAGSTSVTFANTGGGTFSYTAGYSGGGIIANSFLGDVVVAGNVQLTNLDYINASYVNGVIPDASSVSISGGATWTQTSGAETLDALNGSGTLANGGFAITLGESNGTGNFAGVLSGTGSLVKDGTGSQTFSGASPNTYSGTTTINDGTLALGKTAGITSIAGPGAVTIGNGSGTAASAVLQINAGEQIANSVNIALAGTDAQLFSNLPTGAVETIAPLNQLNVIPNDFRGGDVKVGGLGTLLIAGDYTQGAIGDTPGTTTMAGGILKVGSTGGVTPATGGVNTYFLNTGQLQGFGTITLYKLTNDSAINPGDAVAAGKITIQGNLDLTANSVVTLNVNGTGTVTYDQIAVTLNPNLAATKPSTATPFTNGAVFFRGTLNTGSIGAVPSNLTNYDSVMTFVYRLLNTDTAAAALPAGATVRQPTDFNYKNLNQAGPGVRFEPRFVNSTGGVNAISQASSANGGLSDATPSIGAAKSMSLTALSSLASQIYTINVVRQGPTTNFTTRHQNQLVSLTNTSGSAIPGPVYLETDITVGANVRLFNKAGLTYINGKSYVVVSTGDMAAGATITVQLEWANPDLAPFDYATSLFAGGLNTGIFSPGSSPGGSTVSSFTMNGGDAFIFEIANATGSPGNVNGWDTVTVAPTALNPASAQVNLNATSANKYTIFIDSFVNDGVGHTAGPAGNFNPAQSYAWKFVDASSPLTAFNGTFDPASFNIVTTNFQNSFTGVFSVERRDSGKNLYLVYTAPAVITSVAAFIGPTSGGNTVVITGSGFSGVTAVKFGAANATSFTVLSSSQITAVAPAGSATVNVTVVNTAGASATAGATDDYTYVAPAVTSVVVNGGDVVARHRFGVPALANQSSIVEQLLVTFNQYVSLDAGAFTITSLAAAITATGAAPNAANVTVTATGVSSTGNGAGGFTQYVLTFGSGTGVNSYDYSSVGGNAFTTLQDGFYQLNTIGSKVHAGVSDTAANRTDKFWALYGVVNTGDVKTTATLGDGNDTLLVDGLALNDLFATFGSRADASSPTYKPAFDRNLDGFVDGIDLSRLYGNFGTIWRF